MRLALLLIFCATLFSCKSKKDLASLQTQYKELNTDFLNTTASHDKAIKECEDVVDAQKLEIVRLEGLLRESNSETDNKLIQIKKLEEENAFLKANNNSMLGRLEDLSVISQSGAENIKKSLEAINEQNTYIKDLNTSIRQKDSVNLALVTNLKRSLGDVNDSDVNIEVKKGVVYITLSDKMLYTSGSARVNPQAEVVLSKIAKVVNDHSGLDILVEGHTDNVPISRSGIKDNWELSSERALSVVRILQEKYGVNPARMTAGGRGEYYPKASNDDPYGRSVNRRTEILILPKLDEFFKLMEPNN